jgi:hypothetical protein
MFCRSDRGDQLEGRQAVAKASAYRTKLVFHKAKQQHYFYPESVTINYLTVVYSVVAYPSI